MWEHIHPEIVGASRPIVEAGNYDDAVFAAFRVVEASIQERLASRSIGEPLLTEAFGGIPPKVEISSDPRDQRGVHDLFSGALAYIRNDRGHKKAPATPCESFHDCILYLAFASLLLHFLTKDKNTFPRIDSVHILGDAKEPRAELRGAHFVGSHVTASADGRQAIIVRLTATIVEILLPQQFCGGITVIVDGRTSAPAFCDARFFRATPASYYEVVATELVLYSDPHGLHSRPNVVGLLLRANEGSKEFLRIVPTHASRYQSGQYVTHGPFEFDTSIGESWYKDPNTGILEYAWTSSAMAIPHVLGVAGSLVTGGISVLPSSVKTPLGEKRCLRVFAWGSDGIAHKEYDITHQVQWQCSEPSIAFVKNGVVIPKQTGKTKAECEWNQFVGSTYISVEQPLPGERTVYFQGLRNLQQIRFDHEDALYVCNQSPSVHRLDRDGKFSEVVKVSTQPMRASYIDCIAVDRQKHLYVSDILRGVFRFEWNGSVYERPTLFADIVTGPKKSIAVSDSGDIFVAVMGPPGRGWVIRQAADGRKTFFEVDGMTIWLATGPDGNIYIPVAGGSHILVYTPNGVLVERIPHQAQSQSVCDIQIAPDGTIYMACFATGRIMRISGGKQNRSIQTLPHGFGTPGGIALDSHGRLYVSDFAGDSISVVY